MAKKPAVQADNDAPLGHNSITDDDKRVLFFMNRNAYVAALATKKAADAALKNVGKKVKADLGDHGLLQIKLYEESRTPEGEAKIKARMEAERQAARWAGLPINAQVDMFEDLAPLAERAFAEGEEAGLRGDTFDNPHDPNTDYGRQYEAGWKSGQAKLAEGFQKLEADELIKAAPDADPFEDEASRVAAE